MATEIICVDCGGRCHLLSYQPEGGFEPGDVAAYRCADCLDRWDLVIEEGDEIADENPRRAARRASRRCG